MLLAVDHLVGNTRVIWVDLISNLLDAGFKLLVEQQS